ncbi:MAG: chromosomal replication initiator protein DnaA [Neisseria sp.]|nr:chromosomal replication initiator protein DnaA [Neisseria sp.]
MMPLSEFLPQCLQHLQQELSVDQFMMWAGRLSAKEGDGVWIIYVPSDFAARAVTDTFLPLMSAFKESVAPDAPPLTVQVGKGTIQAALHTPANDHAVHTPSNDSAHSPDTAKKPRRDHTAAAQASDSRLNPDYTFENLIVGKGNRFAHAAALAIADEPGKKDYNPFFIYGSTGLGKTHLAQAIGNRILQQMPHAKIRYAHSDHYMQDYIRAVRNKDFDRFKRSYHSFDLLILDDVQFLAGREKTMEEFFQLFNRFLDEGKQFILTSDSPPAEFDKENKDSARIRSRLSWGLSAEIEPPELEMRVAILQKKAEIARFRLPEDTAFFIAQNIRSSVRDLEGALTRVSAYCRFNKQQAELEVAKVALKDILASGQKQITIEQIQKTVADYHQVRISDMRSQKRHRAIVRPRQIAMALAKELTTLSLTEIAAAFNRKDHTTVIHACKTVDDLKNEDAETAQTYDTLRTMLQN